MPHRIALTNSFLYLQGHQAQHIAHKALFFPLARLSHPKLASFELHHKLGRRQARDLEQPIDDLIWGR